MFKKILLAALVVTSAVFAQVNVGGRAAFNFGSVWGENTDNANWGAGFNAGVDVKYNVSPVLSLISGLELDYRRMSDEYDNGYYTVEKAITFMYLDVPVLLRINASPTFFLDAGLTLGFNLSANQTREANGASKSQDISSEVESFEFGLVGGLGFVIIPNLELNFRVAFGMTSMAKEVDNFKNMRFQAGVAYWFM
jgi:hypothetical protein